MSRMHWLTRSLAVAVVYLLTALLVYQFSDPASYAAAVFPSAGLALAATLVWGWRISGGIFLGSFLLNLCLGGSLGQDGLAQALLSFGIACAVLLQALVGAALCQRYARQSDFPGHQWNDLRLILLGGPLACLVAPLLANALIYLGDPQPLAIVLFNVWTWWVGDTLGVVVFAPLTLLVLQPQYRQYHRLLPSVAVPLLVLLGVLVLFAHVNRQEEQRLQSAFRDQARDLTERINLRLQNHADLLRALRRFWQSSQEVDAGEFTAFVSESLEHRADIRFLGWAPQRQNHVALRYVEPGMQRLLLGLDFNTEAGPREAVQRARDSGQITSFPGLRGYSLPGLHNSVVLFMPIYAHGHEPETVAQRRRHFLGVAVGAFDLDNLVASLPSSSGAPLLLTIDDGVAGSLPIYRRSGQADRKPMVWFNRLEIGSQHWRLQITSPAGFRQASRSYEPSLVMFGALLCVGLLQVLLLTLQREQGLRLQTLEAEKARESAEQAAEVKSRFLATMSHEIRTPMNGVIGMTQLLAETRLDDEQKHFVSTIRQSCEALLRILNDILDYSKIEAGRLEIEQLPLDLPALMQECVSLFQQQSQRSRIPLLLQLDAGIPRELMGDPVRIRQVLINLIGNAYKFTREGRIVLRVSMLKSHEDRVELRFEVQDTGIGISNVQRARLFEAFSQGDSSITRQYGGTGLGLSICRLLVSLMQGEMGVQSAPGKGSMFWFSLPLRRLHATAQEAETGTEEKAVADFSRLRVLVVEDNAVNQIVIEGMLKRLGSSLRVVADGVEALHVVTAERQPFDVVLMDCEMPNMDGYTATLRLRQWEQAEGKPPLYICGVSAHVMHEYRQRALEAGMNDFIAKPIRRSELESVLRHALLPLENLPERGNGTE
ncbi:MAG TPA: ATP-binding protein [Moraxellaceae bacterium]